MAEKKTVKSRKVQKDTKLTIVKPKKKVKKIEDVELLPPLNFKEKKELVRLEGNIEKHLLVFVEVGNSLAEIRDKNLYRDTHSNFEDYCRAKWGLGRNYAYKQIAAASVMENLGTFVHKPANEAQARALTGLKPDEQQKVWQSVIDNPSPFGITAALISSAVNQFRLNSGFKRNPAHIAFNQFYKELDEFHKEMKTYLSKHKKRLDGAEKFERYKDSLDMAAEDIKEIIDKGFLAQENKEEPIDSNILSLKQ